MIYDGLRKIWFVYEYMNHNTLYLIFSSTPSYSNENSFQNWIIIRSNTNELQ